MAGALVGGAFLSAFLQVAFDRVASREVLDYLNGRKLIDRLVKKLKIELVSAGAVLNDAENKQITDPAVKKWLDELKDAVYVADDILDEISHEALRCKLEAESTSKVMGFISTFVNSFDKRIQSELENILEQLESITKQKDVLRLEKVAAAAEVPSRPLTTSCPEEYGVFGRDKDMEAIFDMFQSDDASDNGLCVVPIVDSLCNLYKLETLLLLKCESLIELPSKMWRLVNLHHLDLVGTKLKEMPSHTGKLTNLVILTTFVVGKHSGSSIKELGKLHHLSGALSILNLQNVHRARDATEVNLKDKHHLSELVFQCGFDNENSENERHVLEQLCPHNKLESLTIEDYGGTKFPNWLEDCSFSNMMSIQLVNCKYCSSLPPLGHLPVLKRLYVQGFHFVSHVDREFYGDGSSTTNPFRSLEVLSFKDMPEWQEWFLFVGEYEDEGGVLSTLKELCIIECPKLSSGLPSQLPSLIKLEIEKCPQLVASIPRAPTLNKLQLSDCDKVVLKELPPKLDYLQIRGGRILLQSFVEIMTCLAVLRSGVPTTLKSLEIEGTFQITTGHCYPSLERLEIRDDSDSLWSFPLESYPKLKSLLVRESKTLESLFASEESYRDVSSLTYLMIWSSPNFVSFFSGGICAPNLTRITIKNCSKLKSLPENMRTLLPSLEILAVGECPELESFPEGGLPLNLAILSVWDCEKLFSRRMGWGLQDLHSLKDIHISSKCEEVKYFPEEAWLPPTLTYINIGHLQFHLKKKNIGNFPNLKSLKGFQHLTSLKTLIIFDCNNLQYLPEEGFPTSLSSLILEGCPLLKQRCERDKGEEWPKIAQIPNIVIDEELIT
nr:putative disease resistance rpp13-like protein 1 [Quercus suber]